MIAAVSSATLQALHLPHLQGPPAADWLDLSRGGVGLTVEDIEALGIPRDAAVDLCLYFQLWHPQPVLDYRGLDRGPKFEVEDGWRWHVGGRCVSVSW